MSSQTLAPPPPTRARLVVMFWLCGLAIILYLDRICMSQAINPIKKELGLSFTQGSAILMAFTLAYGLFGAPAGRLGDRFGSRSVLTNLVLLWSLFTALTGAGTGLVMLVGVRLLFGAAEAGAYPNAARVISRWFPLGERGRVQGVMLTSGQLGGVFAPIMAAYAIETVGWRWTFPLFGLIGLAWAVGFWLWFRDDPAQHPRVNEGELAQIRANAPPPTEPGPVPWGKAFANRGVICLTFMIGLGAFFTYFFYSWFQTYLNEARGLNNLETGRLASLVLAGAAVGTLLGGWVADRITERSSDPVRARRYLGLVCCLIAAACLFVGAHCDDALVLSFFWCLAFTAYHITLPNWWSLVIPQSGRHVATLFGLMNGIGGFGALVSQGFVGVFADWQANRGYAGREQWDPIFDVYVGILILCAISWWLYRLTPLDAERT